MYAMSPAYIRVFFGMYYTKKPARVHILFFCSVLCIYSFYNSLFASACSSVSLSLFHGNFLFLHIIKKRKSCLEKF